MRIRNGLTGLMAIAVGSVIGIGAQTGGDEQMIRAARARSNAAIAAHDAPAIAESWLDDVHVTTSTGAQGSGRAANQSRMSEQFARRPDTIYVRTPTMIDVYLPWAVASERGEWVGRWTEPDG